MNHFLNSVRSKSSDYFKVLNSVFEKGGNKFNIEQPIEFIAKTGRGKIFSLISKKNITKDSKILSFSLTNGLTGYELQDCNSLVQTRLNDVADKVARKYHETNPTQLYYTINMLKLVFQIYAQKSSPDMTTYFYSNFLYENFPRHVPLLWNENIKNLIFSTHLKNLIDAQTTYMIALGGELAQNGIPALTSQEMLRLVSIIRNGSLTFVPEDPKRFNKDSVLILAPPFDQVAHSLNPNCKLEGYYNSFESDSFVELKAIRDIQENEELTINYGNYNNYDFLMRYGFQEDNNPFDEFYLNLDFEDYLLYTSQLFDLKQKIFGLISDFNIEKISVYKNKIDPNMLATLRIYFLTETDLKLNPEINNYLPKDFKTKINDQNEKLIYELLISNLKKQQNSLNELRKSVTKLGQQSKLDENIFYEVNQLERTQIKEKNFSLYNAIKIGLNEEQILSRNLEFCKKQLNSLSS